MTPVSFVTAAVSSMAIASPGQPSRKEPSGPLLVHFLQPIQRMGSTWMRPNGGLSSSGTQNMQSSTGQYSTHAGEPAQPVQHSVITASSFGFFLRAVVIPLERGSCFNASGTIPATRVVSDSAAMIGLYPFVKLPNHESRPGPIQVACRETAPRYWTRNTALFERNSSTGRKALKAHYKIGIFSR